MITKKGIALDTQEPMDVERWKNIFFDEMRYRGASGQTVGEAWATVESHCVESQTNPAVAFGDPVDYARSLTNAPRRLGPLLGVLGIIWLGGIGLNMAAQLPWVALPQTVDVSWGSLVAVPLSLVALAAVMIMQRGIQREHWTGFVGLFVAFMAWQYVNAWLRSWNAHVLTVPAWGLWLICLVLLLACTAGAIRQVRDRMIDPRPGAAPNALPAFWWWLLAVSPLWGPGALLFFRWLAHR